MTPNPRIILRFYKRNGGPGREQARAAFADWLSCPQSAFAYCEKLGGKPFIREYPDVRIGISHSGKILAAYIGMGNAGIDVERMRPGRDFAGISEAVFTEAERDDIDGLCHPEPASFYRAWTKKEARLKYTGRGFTGLRDAYPIADEASRFWIIDGEFLLCLFAPRSILDSVEVDSGEFHCVDA